MNTPPPFGPRVASDTLFGVGPAKEIPVSFLVPYANRCSVGICGPMLSPWTRFGLTIPPPIRVPPLFFFPALISVATLVRISARRALFSRWSLRPRCRSWVCRAPCDKQHCQERTRNHRSLHFVSPSWCRAANTVSPLTIAHSENGTHTAARPLFTFAHCANKVDLFASKPPRTSRPLPVVSAAEPLE
jgi:hypothetical protein